MPYSGVDDLPPAVRTALPDRKRQERFIAAFNNCMSKGAGAEGDEKRCFRVAYASAKTLGKETVAYKSTVPIHNPLAPIVFVVSEANETEVARQQYLTGPDGKVFNDEYLVPLGITKSDIRILDVSQLDWLRYVRADTVIALGKNAKRALGSNANYSLPHPHAVRKFGNSGEVARKVRSILKSWEGSTPKSEDFTWYHKHSGISPNGAFVNSPQGFIFTGNNGFEAILKSTEDSDSGKKDSGFYEIGVAYDKLIELKLDGTHHKGRYLLKFEPKGEDFVWKIEKPDDETYFAGLENALALRETLIRDLSIEKGVGVEDGGEVPWLYWGKPGESVKMDLSGVDKSLSIPIIKTDDERRIVYGVVLDPHQVDAHNDWISPKEIEETAHQWMVKSRTIGFNHQEEAEAEVVESWLVPYPGHDDYKSAMAGLDHKAYIMPYGNDEVRSGSWVLGTKLSEGDWQLVKEGKLNAYSIGGYGKREPTSIEQMPKVDYIKLCGMV